MLDSTKAAMSQEAAEAQAAKGAAEQERIQYATFSSNQERGIDTNQQETAKLAAGAHDKEGRTKYPYYTDASGRKWTEPELAAYADPTQAAALRYAAATGQPLPTIKPRAGPYADPEQHITGTSILLLPDTRPQPVYTSSKQIAAASAASKTFANIAQKNAEASDKLYSQANEYVTAFEAKYPSSPDKPYQLKDAEEAYQYTKDREELESRTGGIYAAAASKYAEASSKAGMANRLADIVNTQGPKIMAKEGLVKWRTSEEATYASAFAPDMKSDFTKVGITTGIGGAFGGIPGAASGVVVGTGQVLGEKVQLAREKSAFWGIQPVKEGVYAKGEYTFMPQSLISHEKGRTDLNVMGWGLNPDFDALGTTQFKTDITPEQYFALPREEQRKFDIIGRGTAVTQKISWGGTSGALTGVLVAPTVVKTTGDIINAHRFTDVKAIASVKYVDGKETRNIVTYAKAKGIAGQKVGQPVGARKMAFEMGGEHSEGPVTLGKIEGTGAVKTKGLAYIERVGSPIRPGAEAEKVQMITRDIGGGKFIQAFKTDTSGASIRGATSDTTAFGVGVGRQGEGFTIGKNIGVVLQKGKVPAVYELRYAVTGQPGSAAAAQKTGAALDFLKAPPKAPIDFTGINLGSSSPAGGSQAGAVLQASKTASISQATPAIPKIVTAAPTGGTISLSRSAGALATLARPMASTATMYGRGEVEVLQKYKVKEQVSPSIGAVRGPSLMSDAISATRTRPVMSVSTSAIAAPVTTYRTATMTAPITATRIETSTVTKTAVTPGFGGGTPPVPGMPKVPSWTPPPPPPPGLGGGLNIPLGVFERGGLGGARRAKSPSPRYAPSVTASVFNVFTAKKQKATGWTGLEVRPLVIPKRGTIIDRPFSSGKVKKEKRKSGGGLGFATLNPKLGLGFKGLGFGRRRK